MRKITNVFWVSISIVFIMVLFGTFLPNAFETVTENLQQFITDYFSWYYLILVSALDLFFISFMFKSARTIKFVHPEVQPEYSTPTWFAMLFSAGMGLGLVFWGAAEPLMHFLNPPPAAGESPEAYKEAF